MFLEGLDVGRFDQNAVDRSVHMVTHNCQLKDIPSRGRGFQPRFNGVLLTMACPSNSKIYYNDKNFTHPVYLRKNGQNHYSGFYN